MNNSYNKALTIALFIVLAASRGFAQFGPSPRHIQAAEYQVDLDPAIGGSGTAMTPADGNFEEYFEAFTETVNTSSLSIGTHILYVREQRTDGSWSRSYPILFNVTTSSNYVVLSPLHSTQAEYYIDTDPGVGNGTTLTASDGTFDGYFEELSGTINSNSLSVGNHTAYMRMKRNDNTWSSVIGIPFRVIASSSVVFSPAKIPNAEYYVDTDPGQGNGTPLVMNDINYYADMSETINTGSYSVGDHTLYVRALRNDNTWTPVYSKAFKVTASGVVVIAPPASSQAEYFVDTDLGAGNNIALSATDGLMNEFAENVTGTINTSGLQEGLHRLGVRYKNSNGVWGPIYSTLFEIQNTTSPTQTTNVIASAGNKKVTLQWTANTDFDLDYYIIYRSTTSGFTPSTTDSIGFAKSSATTFKDSGLVNNTTYYYKISAVDIAHLISTPSAEVSAMPFYFNKKPVLKLAYNDISVIEDAVAMNLDSIKHHFHDSDGVLTYSLKSLDSTIVIASNVNSELILNFQANAFGITSVVVIATDDSSAVVSDTFKVTINSVNDNTVLKSAFRDTSFNEDFGKVFVCSMTSVFSDPDNSVLTYTNQNLSGGVTTSISNDSLYLISSLNFNGSVNIRVTASDGSTTAMDTFTVNVISVNDAPVAQVDTITVIAGIAKSIAVLLNDNDVEAQTLHIASILQSPLHGTASIDAKDSSIVYTATSTYFGPDSLTYSITDGNGGTASARIRINVLAAPAFKALTLSMALHQNPAISRYADIAIIADTTLQSLPTTMSFFGVDSSAITMTAVSGSSNVFKGGVEFTQSGTYTVKTKATSVTSAQQIISRVFSVTLAKAGFAVKATSLDHMAFLMIAPKTFSGTECFISTQENEKDEIVYHFGPEHSFDQNIELSMSIPENLQEVDPGKLFITQKQNGIWVPIRTQVFPDEKLIKSQVKSLGDFKILFDPNFTGDNTVPKTFALNQNYPNPFNPQTRITFDLPRDGRTTLIVYNTLGQKVKTLTQGFSLAGRYSLSWDGKDERGNMVSSGMYLYRLQTERTAVSKKMLFIK